ncbi:MAG: hypothetical protein EON59_05245 [Alphaproteobacteria bacterium]|nr:MAG: hypothetical protein EON59_05245 [Alphaproteobacteria bacterium]
MRNYSAVQAHSRKNCITSSFQRSPTVSLVIVMCSKRKRAPADPTLSARDLEDGSAQQVAKTWGERLQQAAPTTKAGHLYAGRGFLEARRAAAHLDARLAIVSAGFGLIDATTVVPSYSLTTSVQDPDNVLRKTGGLSADWWNAVQAVTPYASKAATEETGLILAALSSGYLAMVADEWSQWPTERLDRLRLFTKERPSGSAAALLTAWMPYDDRLNAVGVGFAGTQGDFAQRALRHFATSFGGSPSTTADAALVRLALNGLAAPMRPKRPRLADDAIIALIRENWDVVGGRSGAMLTHLRRTVGFGCEQDRFKTLFHAAAQRRSKAA